MVQPELVAYVEKHLRKGVHLDKIKKRLLDAGHKVIAIESAIGHVNHKRHLFRVLTVSGVIFVLMVLGFVLQEQPEEIPSTAAPDAAQPTTKAPEPPSRYGFDTGEYDAVVTSALELKSVAPCQDIDRADIRDLCETLVEESMAAQPEEPSLPPEARSIYGNFENTYDELIRIAIEEKVSRACRPIDDPLIQAECIELVRQASNPNEPQ